MAKITSITIAGPDDPIYTGRWVVSKQGPPRRNKEDDIADIKTILVDRPKKTPNQNSDYSIIIPQVREESSVKKDTKAEETSKTK